MNQLGPDFPLEEIRQRGWCTICGSFGAYTQTPSHVSALARNQPYDEGRSYHDHLRQLDETGQRCYVVYDAETRAIRRDGLTIAQALQWAARANGVQINGVGRFDGYAVTIVKDQEVVWSHPAPLERHDSDHRWNKIYSVLLRENGMQGRYRPASVDQYRIAIAARNPD